MCGISHQKLYPSSGQQIRAVSQSLLILPRKQRSIVFNESIVFVGYGVGWIKENKIIPLSRFASNFEAAERNHFVFFDPPYTVSHENNGFIKIGRAHV